MSRTEFITTQNSNYTKFEMHSLNSYSIEILSPPSNNMQQNIVTIIYHMFWLIVNEQTNPITNIYKTQIWKTSADYINQDKNINSMVREKDWQICQEFYFYVRVILTGQEKCVGQSVAWIIWVWQIGKQEKITLSVFPDW